MKSYIIIVADQGILKAFFINEKSLVHKGKANLIKRIIYTNAHRKLRDLLTDTRGKFQGSGDIRSHRHGAGENHWLKSDIEKKSFKALAHDIEGIITHTPANEYYLSVPKPIMNLVKAEIKKQIASKIKKIIPEDLTKESVADIRARFAV